MTLKLAVEIFVSWHRTGWAYYTPSEVSEAWSFLRTHSISEIEHAVREVNSVTPGGKFNA